MRNDDGAHTNESALAEGPASAGSALLLRLRSGSGLLLDWLLPVVCACCERPLSPGSRAPAPRGWCEACAAALPGLDARRCAVCGEALGQSGPALCRSCRDEPPAFDRTIVLADYAPPLDHLVQAIKFDGQSALAAPLGRLLALAAERACLAGSRPGSNAIDARPVAIVPIPMAPARLSRRGYNQALLLARPVARALGLRIAPAWLRRVREGAPASSLHAGARRSALAQAFAAQRVAPGATVLVVDDVMTTGATLQAAAVALKAAGAAVVVNCVAARTPSHGPSTADTPAMHRQPEC